MRVLVEKLTVEIIIFLNAMFVNKESHRVNNDKRLTVALDFTVAVDAIVAAAAVVALVSVQEPHHSVLFFVFKYFVWKAPFVF